MQRACSCGIFSAAATAKSTAAARTFVDRLRLGISAPEMNNESGRIRGGKPFWSADGVRPFSANGNGHPATVGAKSE